MVNGKLWPPLQPWPFSARRVVKKDAQSLSFDSSRGLATCKVLKTCKEEKYFHLYSAISFLRVS